MAVTLCPATRSVYLPRMRCVFVSALRMRRFLLDDAFGRYLSEAGMGFEQIAATITHRAHISGPPEKVSFGIPEFIRESAKGKGIELPDEFTGEEFPDE